MTTGSEGQGPQGTPQPEQQPGGPQPQPGPAGPEGGDVSSKKLLAGILGIVLGWLGIHKFVLGYTKEGVIMLVVSIVGMLILIGPMVVGVIGLIEGILYLTKSDEEFRTTYIEGHKGWF